MGRQRQVRTFAPPRDRKKAHAPAHRSTEASLRDYIESCRLRVQEARQALARVEAELEAALRLKAAPDRRNEEESDIGLWEALEDDTRL
jgi:hypothetical protein